MKHDFADGKYTVINDNGKLSALRYGEPWQDLSGNNLIYWMLVEVDRLKNQQPTASGVPVAEVHPNHLRPAETGNEHWCREVLLYSGSSPHDHGPDGNYRIKLYAAPQPAPARVSLTDARILDIADDFKSRYQHGGTTFDEFDYLGFARAIEAAHRILPQQLED